MAENKGTAAFTEIIRKHLQAIANEDVLFAHKFGNEKKSVEQCVTYILNQVKKSGCIGFADEEIFGMAIHYYDEEDIEVGEEIKCNVVVNQEVKLTEEKIAEAKRQAIEKATKEQYENLSRTPYFFEGKVKII